MAFINNKGNNSNKINTTTKVFQIYNPEGEDASTLTMGFWNTYVTFKINPALEPSQRTANQVYNYDTTASVIANAEVITTLNEALKDFRREASKGHAESVAVVAGQYVIKVGMAADYEGMEGQYYLGLFEVDDRLVQTGGLFYVFNANISDDSIALHGWDENTGKSVEEIAYESQWTMFCNFIDMAAREVVMGGAHGTNVATNVGITKLTSAVEYLKSLIEMMVGKGGGTTSETKSTGGFGGGFASQRRQRNLGSASPSRAARTQQTSVPEQSTNTMSSGRRTSRNRVTEETVDDFSAIADSLKVSPDSLDVDLDDMD